VLSSGISEWESDLKLLKRPVFTKAKSIVLGLSLLAASINASGFSASVMNNAEKPNRAKDLSYGGVLYEYHQGNAFDALSLLNVAKQKGGIKGHGDHPDLVEGGLLLSYGMTQEAKNIFESLLKEKLSIPDRNLAWFYLGKVFYLEQNYSESLDSFDKINISALNEDAQEKFYELVYIQSQIVSFNLNKETPDPALLSRSTVSINALPDGHVFSYYIRYNQAVSLIGKPGNELAIASFRKLVNALALEREGGEWRNTKSENLTGRVDLAMELKALYNQSLLSLGQLYLQNSQNELAFNILKNVDKDSVFSDQALFAYAISASNLQRHDLALSALTALNQKTLLNPWQQQTPYALAYLYEQLNEPVLALEAYRAAVSKYETLQADLDLERQNLSEDVLLEALNLKNIIGSERMEKDAYGRVLAPKLNVNFVKLLTGETFQRQLSELHELYLIKNSMFRWEKQLSSFEDMLETRLLSRQQKLKATKAELALKEVELWAQKEQQFKKEIETAINTEDAYFFMTNEQIAYYKRLEKAQERLKTLPHDHKKKAQYATRFARAKAYFDWWVYDEFSVNRWRAEKELNALQAEMDIFRQQYQLLDTEQELDDTHLKFVERVSSGKERLQTLKNALNDSLADSSQKLISQVDDAMQNQLAEIGQYLLASREALARVSDRLLVEGKIRYINQVNDRQTELNNETQKVEGEQ
tara:strand:- start:8307 stop:10412 length:2106 start_codon:yes stop_codon:yes gene_type:complete